MSNISPLIDAYGALSAQINALEKQKAALKKQLDFLDAGTHEGEQFVLSVIDSERDTLDMKAVREKLSPQFMRAHTNTALVRTFKATKRKPAEEV